MKQKIILFNGALTFLFLTSCSIGKNLNYSVQGGLNKGGITENTDLSLIQPGDVDAFTGATRMGFNAGMRTTKSLKKNQVETGIDYMFNRQTFNYSDAVNEYSGSRDLAVSQFMVPLTYNVIFLKKQLPNQEIKLKAGVVGQFNFVSENENGMLPEYSINPFSAGATVGLAAFPVLFSNGNKLGFFVEGYRGSRIYEDFYNQPEFETVGSSFVKFGISFQFK